MLNAIAAPNAWASAPASSPPIGALPAKTVNAFDMTCVGHQAPGLWRHPQDQSHRYRDVEYWTDLARLLERGRFTSLFIADVVPTFGMVNMIGGECDR